MLYSRADLFDLIFVKLLGMYKQRLVNIFIVTSSEDVVESNTPRIEFIGGF